MLQKHIFLGLLIFQVLLIADVEEVVVTGSLIDNLENDSSPIEVINKEDLENLNITQLAEISKYLNISSGSRFQTNALEGTDQGMTSITLRGLDHASTLLLINSDRHTFAGTTSDDGTKLTSMQTLFQKLQLKELKFSKKVLPHSMVLMLLPESLTS